ncbi:MAG: phosphatidylglycerophosphatase A [candidate division WOR-3 bacterium]
MKSVIFWFQAACGSVLFTGYFPVAPATVSSLFALIPAYFLSCRPLVSALVIIPVFFFGVWIAGDLEKVWGKDPRRVTIDELAGTLITFFGLPVSLAGLLVGFLVWRFFDIVKLPFIRKSQELPGGWGVMIDDVLAGICANLVLRVLVLFFPVLRRG